MLAQLFWQVREPMCEDKDSDAKSKAFFSLCRLLLILMHLETACANNKSVATFQDLQAWPGGLFDK